MATTPTTTRSSPCNNCCNQGLCGNDDNDTSAHGPYYFPTRPSGDVGRDFTAATTSLVSELDYVGNAFAKLSNQEKEAAYNDVHGCPDAAKEDPEETAKELTHLDAELRKKIEQASSNGGFDPSHPSTRNGPSSAEAYVQAYYQNKDYVEDRKFRLAFLRAELYNPEGASQRICRFFEIKLQLFGSEKLTKPISYDDLSDDDKDSLLSGSLQLLPLKDRAGRLVLVVIGAKRQEKTLENFMRANFYIYMKLLDISDESLQKRGYVGILYNMTKSAISKGQEKVARLRDSVPLRIAAAHICFKVNALKVIFNVAFRFLSASVQYRMKIHSGSHTECSYALRSYGVPSYVLPIVDNARINAGNNDVIGSDIPEYEYPLDYHMKFVEVMKESDKTLLQNVQSQEEPDPFFQNLLDELYEESDVGFSSDNNSDDNGGMESAVSQKLLAGMPDNDDDADTKEGNDEADRDMSSLDQEGSPNRSMLFGMTSLAAYNATNDEGADSSARGLPANGGMMDNATTETTAGAATEKHDNDEGGVMYLNPEDVLLGRGRPANEYPGNMFYRQVVVSLVDTYENANRQQKTALAKSIVEKIKGRGGRFVRFLSSAPVTCQDIDIMLRNENEEDDESKHGKVDLSFAAGGSFTSTMWREIDDTAARAKVAAAFRTIRNPKIKGKQEDEGGKKKAKRKRKEGMASAKK